jgi:hypothetical protein
MTRHCTLTVFVGPSLRAGDHIGLQERAWAARSTSLTVDIRPPIRRGDLTTTVERGAPGDVVLILDGEFGQQLAVSVLEIRDTLAACRLVLGASSMGALRAAECAELGMLGFGAVFRDFRDDRLRSDVEVALLFDPESYQPITIPLVNVRWIAALLLSNDTISSRQHHTAVRAAEQLPFRARTAAVLARTWTRTGELETHQVEQLLRMLAPDTGAPFDRKRLDALEALEIAELLASNSRDCDLEPWLA